MAKKLKSVFKSNQQKYLQLVLDSANDEIHYLKENGYKADEMSIGEVYEVLMLLKRKIERLNNQGN